MKIFRVNGGREEEEEEQEVQTVYEALATMASSKDAFASNPLDLSASRI